jgi:membrane-associated phospholipid phosphatase
MRSPAFLLPPSLLLAGCASLPHDLSWQHAGHAAADAARDPWVWAPLAGAAALQVGDADRRISRWAMRETPLFGSAANADRTSDTLRSIAVVADAAVLLSEPRRDASTAWAGEKVVQYAEDLASATAAIGITRGLKSATGRSRPSGADDESFPSGHVTIAAAYDRLAVQRLQRFDIDPTLKRGVGYGLGALTFATAWARIEAGAHYPSDTLAGMAIGAFSARFFEGWLRDGDAARLSLAVAPERGGARLAWRVTW